MYIADTLMDDMYVCNW